MSEKQMQAMLVIKAKDGYAVAPYTGEVPADFVQNMTVTEHELCVSSILSDYFEQPPEPTTLKAAA